MTTSYTTEFKNKIERPVIRLYFRDKNGNRVIKNLRGFVPYFYAPSIEVRQPTHIPEPDVFDRWVVRVDTQLPKDVGKQRQFYNYTCEADVPYPWRYLIDHNIYCGATVSKDKQLIPTENSNIPMRIGFGDIEINCPPEIMPKPQTSNYPVVSFQVKDSYTGKKVVLLLSNKENLSGELEHRGERIFITNTNRIRNLDLIFQQYDGVVLYCKSEETLLRAILELIRYFEFDVLAGWWWNQFDMPYLHKRIKSHKGLWARQFYVKPHPAKKGRWIVRSKGFESIDLLAMYAALTKPEGQKASFDLKYIVKLETNGEFTYEDIGSEIQKYWNEDHETLIKYCLDDCEALDRINKARRIIEYYDSVRRKVGCPLHVAHIRNRVIKFLMLRISKKPIPTRDYSKVDAREKETDEERGGDVSEPVRGLHEFVGVFDVKGMYPIIMESLNVGAETKSPTGTLVAANGVRFKRRPKSLLSRIIVKYRQEKEYFDGLLNKATLNTPEYELINTERETTKYTLNAGFGVNGWKPFEMYDEDVADAITATGRYIKRSLEAHLTACGYTVLYGDTDSVHVKLKSLKDGYTVLNILQLYLDKFVKDNKYTARIEIGYEKLFRRVLYVTKKRYAGWCTFYKGRKIDKIFIYGLPAKRSDTPLVTVELMENFLDTMLKTGMTIKGFEMIKQVVYDFDTYQLSEIGTPKGLSRPIETYDKFAWAVAARWSIQHLGLRFNEDQKPLLIWGKVKPPHMKRWPEMKYFAIRGEEDDHLKSNVILNKKKMLELVVWSKFESIIEALGFEKSDVYSDTSTRRTVLTDVKQLTKRKVLSVKRKRTPTKKMELTKFFDQSNN